MRLTMDVLTLYNFDKTLFDDMYVPEILNKELLVNDILFTTAGLECVYPDADLMKTAIRIWSNTCAPSWDKLAATMEVKYDFLNPYYKKETFNEKILRERDETVADKGTYSDNETVTDNGLVDKTVSGKVDDTGTGTVSHDVTRSVNGTEGGNVKDVEHGTVDKSGTGSRDTDRTTNGSTTTSAHTDDSTDQTTIDMVSAFNSTTFEPSKKQTVNTDYTSDASGSTTNKDTVNENVETENSENTTSDGTKTTTRNLTSSSSEIGKDIETRNTKDSSVSSSTEKVTSGDEKKSTGVGESSNNRNLDENETVTTGHELIIEGNNGNNPFQELLQKERDVSLFSLYEFITQSFKQYFCIGVY